MVETVARGDLPTATCTLSSMVSGQATKPCCPLLCCQAAGANMNSSSRALALTMQTVRNAVERRTSFVYWLAAQQHSECVVGRISVECHFTSLRPCPSSAGCSPPSSSPLLSNAVLLQGVPSCFAMPNPINEKDHTKKKKKKKKKRKNATLK